MASLRLYTAIFVALIVMATAQAWIESGGFNETVVLAGIVTLSFAKAILVAGYYQHLFEEPRAVSLMVIGGLLAVILLILAASYSIV